MSAASERALAYVRGLAAGAPPGPEFTAGAAITVNFHPDRLLADGRTVAEHLFAEGRYRNQFETGISNGGLNAYLGGDRDRWEHRMFDGAYAGMVADRPVYGALNLAGYVDGASPRFGSCYLMLRPEVSARATFSHGDSVTEPTVVGTADTFGAIWEALLGEVARTGKALGLAADGPAAWVAALRAPRGAVGRCMDDYVETQIHGGVDLRADVTAVVADPSFAGTPTAELLSALAPDLRWHPGFVLPVDAVPESLRGPVAPRLAAHLGDVYDTGVLHVELVGRAARSVVTAPADWADFGPPAEVLQQLKYLWHILVILGAPANP